MNNPDTASVVDFIQSIDLPPTPPAFDSAPEPATFGTQPEAAGVGSQITEFSANVTPAQRSAVADCLLLAQLAANKATAGNPDQMAWYRKYIEVLQTVGWTTESMDFETRQVVNTNLSVHQEIIPVLTAALGPAVAAASMIISVLTGLQNMNKSTPWITLFDRASQKASGATFQLGYVDAGSGDGASIHVKLVAVSLDAKNTITQVLFFKFSDAKATLRTASGQLGIVGARLDAIKDTVASRVLPFVEDTVAHIDI